MLRWAIALDDGRLVFAAEGGLEPALKLSSLTEQNHGCRCTTRWVSVRKDAVHNLNVRRRMHR